MTATAQGLTAFMQDIQKKCTCEVGYYSCDYCDYGYDYNYYYWIREDRYDNYYITLS